MTTVEMIQGNDFLPVFDLASLWKNTRLDPNDYYKLLGLAPDKPYLMWQVRNAYNIALREKHPDTGDGDVETFERIMIAGEVLCDPITRREYDELQEGDKWQDRITQKVAADEATARIKASCSDEDELWEALRRYEALIKRDEYIRKSRLEKLRKEAEGFVYKQDDESKFDEVDLLDAGYKKRKDGYTFYYEGEMPERSFRDEWISTIGYAYHLLKIKVDKVRVGFTDGPFDVKQYAWGHVIMVNNKVPADTLVALCLVHKTTICDDSESVV